MPSLLSGNYKDLVYRVLSDIVPLRILRGNKITLEEYLLKKKITFTEAFDDREIWIDGERYGIIELHATTEKPFWTFERG